MPLITIKEIIELGVVSLVVGYIFSGMINTRIKTAYDYLHPKKFDWEDFKFSVLVAAPAVVLHELGHKFVAMSFGLVATFQPWIFGLGLGVILKFFGSPFIIFAPGYVLIGGLSNNLVGALIAFSGPAVNLILWLTSSYVIKKKRSLSTKEAAFWGLTRIINQWLFIFNMLPIPPLDGSKVLWGLIGSV